MKKILILLLCLGLAGCATSNYSLRESIIRSKIPETSKTHTGGIVKNPSRKEISDMIKLGQVSKDDKDILEYAYIYKVPRGFFDVDSIYIIIKTPLYLIAEHAMAQAREYREIDKEYIEYLKGLNAVEICLLQQYTNYDSWNAYAFKRQIILLRDGVRIPHLTEIASYKGKNPFKKLPQNIEVGLEDGLAYAKKSIISFLNQYYSAIPPEGKKELISAGRLAGLSNTEIAKYAGAPIEEVRKLSGGRSSKSVVYLSEFDGIYSIDELKKSGEYEIIFRTPSTRSLFTSGDREIRFSIDFRNYK